jgi:zinc transport system substrate-binding protein
MAYRKFVSVGLLWAAFCLPWLTGVVQGAEPRDDGDKKIKVFVSIPPQAYFLERIGGDRVDISVMVGPGQSPATYEPRPKQMAEISKARFFFSIGVPFEKVWIERINKANPMMKIVDTRRGVDLMPMDAPHHHEDEKHNEHQTRQSHDTGMKDPHIWLSLRLVKIQAENIAQALIDEDPAYRAYYEENLKSFHEDLESTDREISKLLRKLKTRKFMVFHPTWGYFARDYGLEQVPIEIQGKEPNAKDLEHLIKLAGAEDIRAIFVQKQFSKQSAGAVARAIGGDVVQVDPLSRGYLKNMKGIAETFAEVLQ